MVRRRPRLSERERQREELARKGWRSSAEDLAELWTVTGSVAAIGLAAAGSDRIGVGVVEEMKGGFQ